MSKLIYVISRVGDNLSKERLELIEKRITPDNLSPNPLKIITDVNSICAIFNYVSTIQINGSSVCLGYSPNNNWDELDVRADEIEGSFVIFRNNKEKFQVVTDCVESRTLWYYFDDNLFIASTSQRAIITYLGSFRFNEQVIPWMLSSGTPGPGLSYDKRIKMLEPNSLVTLNKNSWSVNIDEKYFEIKQTIVDRNEAKKMLHKALKTSFDSYSFDNSKIGLPLSGGYDSRAILLYLNNSDLLRTITWGTAESRFVRTNDAYIAAQLSNSFGLVNHFFESYNGNVPVKEVLSRFINCSEGRIDHVRGYLDGMNMWKAIFEEGYECILRGDEEFGDGAPRSELSERGSKALITLDDFTNTKTLRKKVKLKKQEIPKRLKYSNYSEKNYWVGRLAFDYDTKAIYSALNDIKLSYVEIVEPLLSSSILKTIASNYNASFTENKNLYKELIEEQYSFPFALQGANKPLKDFLNTSELINLFIETFSDSSAKVFVPVGLLEYTINRLKKQKQFHSLNEFVSWFFYRAIPKLITGNTKKLEMDWRVFALRLYILIETCKMMEEDSKSNC